jgi:hypothetical protein
MVYCKYLKFTGHAIRQMFLRQISDMDVRNVVNNGEVIKEYPDDKPLPSKLMLGFSEGRPIHVVLAYNAADETGYVITAYIPDTNLWTSDFKTRREP